MKETQTTCIYLSLNPKDALSTAQYLHFSEQLSTYLSTQVLFFEIDQKPNQDPISTKDLPEDLQNIFSEFEGGMVIVNHICFVELVNPFIGKENCSIVYHKTKIEHLDIPVKSGFQEVKKTELTFMRQVDWLFSSSQKLIEYCMTTLGYREHKHSILQPLWFAPTKRNSPSHVFYQEGCHILVHEPLSNKVLKHLKTLLMDGEIRLTLLTEDLSVLNKMTAAHKKQVNIISPGDFSSIEILDKMDYCLISESTQIEGIVKNEKIQADMLAFGVKILSIGNLNSALRDLFREQYYMLGDSLQPSSEKSKEEIKYKVAQQFSLLSDENSFKLRNLENLFLNRVNRIN